MSSGATPVLNFPPSRRVKKRREFLFIRKQGRYLSINGVTFQWVRTALPYTRIGITASTKNGSAVERSLFRRRVREAFRHSGLFAQPGLDINVKARERLPISYDAIVDGFQHLFGIVHG